MTSKDFVEIFGVKALRFIETQSNEPLEQKAIRDILIEKSNSIFNGNSVRELIQEGKENAATTLVKQLRYDIAQKEKRLLEAEENLKKKRKKDDDNVEKKLKEAHTSLLNDNNDELFTQVNERYDIAQKEKRLLEAEENLKKKRKKDDDNVEKKLKEAHTSLLNDNNDEVNSQLNDDTTVSKNDSSP